MAVLGKNRWFDPLPVTSGLPPTSDMSCSGQTIEGQKRILASKLLGGQSERGKARPHLVRSSHGFAAGGYFNDEAELAFAALPQARPTGLALAEPLLVDPLVRVVLTQCQKRFVHMLA